MPASIVDSPAPPRVGRCLRVSLTCCRGECTGCSRKSRFSRALLRMNGRGYALRVQRSIHTSCFVYTSTMPFRSNPFQGKPTEYLIAHTDGGARGNPGPAGFGVSITDQDGNRVIELSEYLGNQTNNVAEYSALIAALEWAVSHGHRAVQI